MLHVMPDVVQQLHSLVSLMLLCLGVTETVLKVVLQRQHLEVGLHRLVQEVLACGGVQAQSRNCGAFPKAPVAEMQGCIVHPDQIPSVLLSLAVPVERLGVGVTFRLQDVSSPNFTLQGLATGCIQLTVAALVLPGNPTERCSLLAGEVLRGALRPSEVVVAPLRVLITNETVDSHFDTLELNVEFVSETLVCHSAMVQTEPFSSSRCPIGQAGAGLAQSP